MNLRKDDVGTNCYETFHNLTGLFGDARMFLFWLLAHDLKSEHALQGFSSSSPPCEGGIAGYYHK